MMLKQLANKLLKSRKKEPSSTQELLNLQSLNFKAQILEKIELWYAKSGDFKFYEALKLSTKLYYEKSFDYNFSLSKHDLERMFKLIFDDAKARLYDSDRTIDIFYKSLFLNIPADEIPFVTKLDENLECWIEMQNLLFKKLELKPINTEPVIHKFGKLFKENYLDKFSLITLYHQKLEFANKVFFDLISEAINKANYSLAEFDVERLSKEARIQLVFEIKNSGDLELLKEYLKLNSAVLREFEFWFEKQLFLTNSRLLHNTKDEFYDLVFERYASHPYEIYSLNAPQSKTIFKEFLNKALDKTGYITKKMSENNGIILLKNEVNPVFLQSFIYNTNAWCATYLHNAITDEEKEKINKIKETLLTLVVNEMDNYRAKWLLKKDENFGEMLFYQLLPIAFYKLSL
ncbi:MAG: hypothetical protein GX282_05760 [Campylobacteraceae bacterium]|nr:hypothetical protein [Campylobacteraceae bacterium]